MRLVGLAATALAAAAIGAQSAAVAHAATTCEALSGVVDASQNCRVQSTQPAYTVNITFPAEYPDAQAVTDYLIQQRDGFVNVAEMPGSRGLPYEMDAAGTGYFSGAPARTQSLAFELFQDVGGAHPVTWFKAFNYDIENQGPITFDTLFKPGIEPLDVIFPIVQRELDRQTGASAAIVESDGLDPTNYQNFAITDTSLIFFFGQGELLPESAGANVVAVPRESVASLLA